MAYGTGTIPFIRTTDIAELEVKADPRQGISQGIYTRYQHKAGLVAGDIILVRDGTYLVGSSALVTSANIPALICGGIYRLRSIEHEVIDPIVLLGLLNIPLVRWQMRARQFTRDVIDTLGMRLMEIRIPNPKSQFAENLGKKLVAQMAVKHQLRVEAATVLKNLEPNIPPLSRDRPGWSMR